MSAAMIAMSSTSSIGMQLIVPSPLMSRPIVPASILPLPFQSTRGPFAAEPLLTPKPAGAKSDTTDPGRSARGTSRARHEGPIALQVGRVLMRVLRRPYAGLSETGLPAGPGNVDLCRASASSRSSSSRFAYA